MKEGDRVVITRGIHEGWHATLEQLVGASGGIYTHGIRFDGRTMVMFFPASWLRLAEPIEALAELSRLRVERPKRRIGELQEG